MGNPRDISNDHFTIVPGTDTGNSKDRHLQRLRCKYCNVYEVRRHSVRQKNHLMECPDTPQDVKDVIEEHCGNDFDLYLPYTSSLMKLIQSFLQVKSLM